MLKIGVLGAGHLGKIHIKLIKELEGTYELVGVYDPDPERAKEAEKEFEVAIYGSMEELVNDVDVLDVVTPTLSHYDCASYAIKCSKHVFVEKPITNSIKEARSLMRLTEEANVKLQVGHVERYNPAFKKALPFFDQPMFIESHRLAQFNPRGTDVPVILDLMIHDIDLVLSVVNSNIRRVSASGVAVISETPDIANARIEFDNGCVANLTSSRISLKNMRRARFFQKDAYIVVDMLEKETQVVRMQDMQGKPDPFAMTLDVGEDKPPKQISFEKPDIDQNNPIQEELSSFAEAIQNDRTPDVTVQDGYRALDVAYKIVDRVRSTSGLMEESE